jgi:UDP-glucuronate decarboxylase
MKKILITGGAGNIGSSLAKKLLTNNNYFVCVVDNLSTGDRQKLPSNETANFKFIKADVNEFEDICAIMTTHKFDFVFHYAAVVGVSRTLSNPVKVLNDIEGIRNVLQLSKNTGVKRVFYSSSSEVYGEPVCFPQNEETTPLNSKLPYAIVKNIGEAYCKSYYQEFGLEYTIFRFFNTYGPSQSTDFVIPRFIKKALTGDTIYINGDGKQTRTFCYIDDNIETTIKILEGNIGVNDVVNIGSNIEMTILELAETIIRLIKSSSKIVHVQALKEGDMTRRQPDNNKMLTILNRNLVSVEDGISRLIKENISK